ncbi:hypothetical protein [Terasakiella sp. SH-1]|uniref:hypothetical protein n=1 Tax=Terasakiella sp. SH-1 TaxID=2560057 RepID=UPI00107393AD|nr:hypothetical protein [Terasakiella sp. SH-1]
MPAPQGQVFKDQLPEEIYSWLEADFLRKYPVKGHCLGVDVSKTSNCWKTHQKPTELYDVNADGIWQNPVYSRVVSDINFSDVMSLRGGFINRSYNWYDTRSDVKRADMPFFVLFEFKGNNPASQICWRGKVAWVEEKKPVVFLHHLELACRSLEKAQGLKLYGNGIDSLEMRLETSFLMQIHQFAPYVGAVLLVLLLVRVEFKQLFLPFGFVCASLSVLAGKVSHLFTALPVYPGGLDGLTHDSMSRLMLDGFLRDDWSKVFQGGVDIFYYMPGLRYFRFLEHLMFGETVYGYLIILTFVPLVLYSLLRIFIPSLWLLPVMGLFFFTPFVRSFGLSFPHYMDNMALGFPGALGYGLFLLSLCVLVKQVLKEKEVSLVALWLGGLFLAFAVFMRPNMAPGAAVLLLGLSVLFLRQGNLKNILWLGFGFSPLLFVPFHNWYFGGVFVPFTTAATASVNLHAPPALWIEALGDLLSFDMASGAVEKCWEQLSLWSKGWHPLHLWAFLSVVFVCFNPFKTHFALRLISYIALVQHSVLWVFTAHSRYAWLAWLLSFVVTVALSRAFFWQMFATRSEIWNKIAHLLEPTGLSNPPVIDIDCIKLRKLS